MRFGYRRLIGLLCIGYALYMLTDALNAAENPAARSADIEHGGYL